MEGATAFATGGVVGSGLGLLFGPTLLASGGAAAFTGELALGGADSVVGNASVQLAEITFNPNLTFSDDFSFKKSEVAFTAGVAGSTLGALATLGTATALADAGLTTGSYLAEGLAFTTAEKIAFGGFATAVDVGIGALTNTFGDTGAQTRGSFGASGGFVLYPSRSNLNQAESVYRK